MHYNKRVVHTDILVSIHYISSCIPSIQFIPMYLRRVGNLALLIQPSHIKLKLTHNNTYV